MARGQVWLASVPFQEDPSSSKNRPVIVLGEFPDGDVFAAKVTSQDVEARGGKAYRLDGYKRYGLRKMSWVNLGHALKLPPGRFMVKFGSIPHDVLRDIEAGLGGRPSGVTARKLYANEWMWL